MARKPEDKWWIYRSKANDPQQQAYLNAQAQQSVSTGWTTANVNSNILNYYQSGNSYSPEIEMKAKSAIDFCLKVLQLL